MKVIQIVKVRQEALSLIVLTDTGQMFFGELDEGKSNEGLLAYYWREISPPEGE